MRSTRRVGWCGEGALGLREAGRGVGSARGDLAPSLIVRGPGEGQTTKYREDYLGATSGPVCGNHRCRRRVRTLMYTQVETVVRAVVPIYQ